MYEYLILCIVSFFVAIISFKTGMNYQKKITNDICPICHGLGYIEKQYGDRQLWYNTMEHRPCVYCKETGRKEIKK